MNESNSWTPLSIPENPIEQFSDNKSWWIQNEISKQTTELNKCWIDYFFVDGDIGWAKCRKTINKMRNKKFTAFAHREILATGVYICMEWLPRFWENLNKTNKKQQQKTKNMRLMWRHHSTNVLFITNYFVWKKYDLQNTI